MPLSNFALNMNVVFARFLARRLAANAPADIHLVAQDVRSDVFSYLENAGGDPKRPSIRLDLVFRQNRGLIAVTDTKHKNRHESPPSPGERYQLTTYGLACPMLVPREVLLLNPLANEEQERSTSLLFAPDSVSQSVYIRLVGVPVDLLLDDSSAHWWPLARRRTTSSADSRRSAGTAD